ncbi:hypothetical protein A2U01_0020715 [Trifolium medium]|uniref:Uncharacterized protein n=1 Tax=Trifolium medium TaxID=97028 RepID=A0A392NIR0_9FABA|nr:hypothetical protein [Trifolium medium]
MDVETRNKSRLDVARVKLSCPLLGSIDKVVPVEDDQLRWSVVASSCKSLDEGPVMAMVEESMMGDSDSDGSIGDQVEEQATKGTVEDFHRLKKVNDDAFALSIPRRASSSLRGLDREGKEDIGVGVSVAAEKVGFQTSLVDCDGCGPVFEERAQFSSGLKDIGPIVVKEFEEVDVRGGVGVRAVDINKKKRIMIFLEALLANSKSLRQGSKVKNWKPLLRLQSLPTIGARSA